MPYEIVMPRLGWNMESGSLGQWLKQDGDQVEEGELLFTVEGEKAVQEVEALESGVLRIPPDSPPPGKEAPVGTLLAYLVKPGETAPFEAAEVQTIARPAAQAPTISPRARRVAQELGVDWTGLHGSGSSGRIVERDIRQAAAAPLAEADRVSPLARRLAAQLGVDLVKLAAAIPGRRIERADVEAAAAPPTPVSSQPGIVVPISPVRRTIGQRMATSVHTAAAVTLTTEVDATELVELRKQLQEEQMAPVPSYTDLLAKIAASALMEHPALNARLDGDTIVQAATVNIGIAVDTERGLLAPVLRDVQTKSLRRIARESAALIAKTRSGHAGPDDLHGATFTITNLGMFEIDAFTPIINLPECAILGLGRIVPKQVVVDADAGRVAIRRMAFLSLTFDHRLVDGATAARFLQRVKHYVEKPYLWLVAD